jgi:archaellum component FlaC
MIDMATTDERVDKLETRFLTLEQQVSAVTAKVDTFIGEMRDRDNQRVAEIAELRQRQDADRKALEDKIDRLGDKIQNMVIAAVVGFGAIVFAAVSTLK